VRADFCLSICVHCFLLVHADVCLHRQMLTFNLMHAYVHVNMRRIWNE
jgi:hypothetical protein